MIRNLFTHNRFCCRAHTTFHSMVPELWGSNTMQSAATPQMHTLPLLMFALSAAWPSAAADDSDFRLPSFPAGRFRPRWNRLAINFHTVIHSVLLEKPHNRVDSSVAIMGWEDSEAKYCVLRTDH